MPRHQPVSDTQKPVSVIICAHNEAANLARNLPAILAQRYMNEAGKHMYEVIVVNDASTDDTEKVLYELSQQYTQLWSVTIAPDEPRTAPGKKFALGKGIMHASHDVLLMTDADCKPSSENWLAKMVAPLNEGKQVSVGIGKYAGGSGFLNAFIRWETMHSFLQYSTYILAGKPYMAVGRNVACHKSLLISAQESSVWGKLPSGDDDLMMRNADKEQIAIVTDAEAITVSPAKKTFDEWLHQKQRHMSTGKYYKPEIIGLLGVYACAHALAWLMFIVLLFTSYWQLALAVMLCRVLVSGMIWSHAAAVMNEKKLTAWFMATDFSWMLYNFALSPYIFWKNKLQWK